MSGAAGARFEESYSKSEEQFKRVESELNKLVSNVNGVIDWLPESVAKQVRDGVTELKDLIARLFKEAWKFMTQPGSPGMLWEAGTAWSEQVGAQAATLAAGLKPTEMRTYNEWKGRAAIAYKESISTQQDALKAIQDAAKTISSSVTSIGNALIAFWIAIGVALVTYVIGMVGAAIAAATAVGTLPAVAAAVKATGVVIAAVGAITTGLYTFLSKANTEQAKLSSELQNNPAFPDQRWPKSTSDISDASVADGDSSDWTVR